MKKKQDVINSFLQAKKGKRKQKTVLSINRKLGSQVLKTAQVIKSSKLKASQYNKIDRADLDKGFKNILKDVRENLPVHQRFLSHIIHSPAIETVSLILNEYILNSSLLLFFSIAFFSVNLLSYSFFIVNNYQLNPSLLLINASVSYICGLVVLIVKKLKK